MSSAAFAATATQKVNEAVIEDSKGNFEAAITLYSTALEYLIAAKKHEKAGERQEMLTRKINEYMTRAELLKKNLLSQNGNSSPRENGGTGTAKKGDDGESKEDKESSARAKKMDATKVSGSVNVSWDDVAGLESAKEALMLTVITPIEFPHFFTGKRKPASGILLYGPPGTGKSYLAKAVATEVKGTFFSVSSSDLMSKWQGEAEQNVKALFESARESKPAVIFLDEIDSVCSQRGGGNDSESSNRVKTEFLVQMQGVGSNNDGVLFLGATNLPWNIDEAMRRRFQKRIYIPLPDTFARSTMFKIHVGKDTPHRISPEEFRELGQASDGYSGSDLSVVVQSALMEPVQRCLKARQFVRSADSKWRPCRHFPNCPQCPKLLAALPVSANEHALLPCRACGAVRMGYRHVTPKSDLVVPEISFDDMMTSLSRNRPTVGTDELDKYVDWTAKFGEEGS